MKSFRNGSTYFSKHVYFYAPPGMEIESMKVDGDWVQPFREGNEDLGRVVVPFEMRMPPGSTVSVEVTLVGAGDFAPLEVWSNPARQAHRDGHRRLLSDNTRLRVSAPPRGPGYAVCALAETYL